MELNKTSLDALCSGLCYAMGIDAPAQAAEKKADFCVFLTKNLQKTG